MKRLFDNWLNFWDQKLDWRVQIIFPIFYSIFITIICLIYLEKNITQIIGFLLIVLGFSLLLIARFQLREQFSTKTRNPHKLLKTGLYKRIKHPVYMASLIALFGICVFFIGKSFSAFVFFFWIIFFEIQRKRSQKEEKLLVKKFGEEYKEYCKQTWF